LGLVATDILVKSAIEGALDHLRKNQWLLDDVWGDLAVDTMSKVQYGWKDVDAAKKWFNGNNILVTFAFRDDQPVIPCISVVVTSTAEMGDRTTIGDEGDETDDFDPKKNAILPQKVYLDFTPKKFDREQGLVTLPDGVDSTYVVPGQFLVAKSGKAYQIYQVIDAATFKIKENLREDFTGCYIAPPTSLWNAKGERSRVSESVVLGIHAQSDPVQCAWMRMLVMYILFRYKEAYLESRGFELSTFSCSEIDLNPSFRNSDKVFSCFVTLNGEVEAKWIKYVAPKLQSTQVSIRIADGPKTPEGYLKQVQKQGWSMPEDPPPVPADNLGGINVDGDEEDGTLLDGIDQIDGSEDDQG
jgi:hypothetical protein